MSAIIPLTAWAQPVGRDPLNAQTTTPPITYQSAFSDYKPYQDPEVMPWKTANDVVREFGSMATMGDMSDAGNPDTTDAKPGGSEKANLPTQPADDMSNIKSETPSPASKKPASSSKPEIKSMPGHDMSKMQGPKSQTNTPKVAPTTGPKDKGEMADMPGYDMSKMQKTPAVPATKTPLPSSKPATPAPMPDHSGMSK